MFERFQAEIQAKEAEISELRTLLALRGTAYKAAQKGMEARLALRDTDFEAAWKEWEARLALRDTENEALRKEIERLVVEKGRLAKALTKLRAVLSVSGCLLFVFAFVDVELLMWMLQFRRVRRRRTTRCGRMKGNTSD
jgi:hypothetical protein